MDQHGRNVQHGPISNRAVTIKQRRVMSSSQSISLYRATDLVGKIRLKAPLFFNISKQGEFIFG